MLHLLLLLAVLPAFAQSAPYYDNPYAPIYTDKPVYTWTDKIKMTIVAPSWNTDRYLIDTIGGTGDHSINIGTSERLLGPYKFVETDVNSGVFAVAVIPTGFVHDADGDGDDDTTSQTRGSGPTNGFLEVGQDSAISISFEFADGVVLVDPPSLWVRVFL